MKGENDCGCFGTENRALWFAPGKIEVPHEYVAAITEFPSARGPSLIILLGVILLAATAFALTFAVLKVRRGG
jgi:hypothetical protein